MPIRVECPNATCGQPVRVGDDMAGSTIFCPRCRQSIVIPKSTDAPLAGAPATHDRAPPPPSPPKIPTQIGRYAIREQLGAGGFGVVYRAFDTMLEREVALKVPRFDATLPEHAELAARFLREARVAAQLHHSNVTPVFDAGLDGITFYMASAFIHGTTLAAAIPKGGMPVDRAVRLALQLTEALAHAHERGVVHRDVKPGNCLLDKDDHLFLTDFGLAGWLDSERSRLTRSGQVFGTPAYMAPEQAAGRTAELGPAADQYAVGAVLFHLLTGRPPFLGNVADIMHLVMHQAPPSPTRLRPGLDPRLGETCLRAMAKQPSARFANCGELATALRDCLNHNREANTPLQRPTTATESAELPSTLAAPVAFPNAQPAVPSPDILRTLSPQVSSTAATSAASPSRPFLPIMVVAGLVVLAGALAWWLLGR